jgi:outer membrane receptor protein involved in Fe transport
MGKRSKIKATRNLPQLRAAPRSGSLISLAVAAALAEVAAPRPSLAQTPVTDTTAVEPSFADTAAVNAAGGGALQEVVVTARKREEVLQDVPMSIDVLTTQDIQNLGIVSFDDYAIKTPSVSFISIGPGTQTFYIRGVSDGTNPNYANTSATGFFLDDSSLSWYGVQPDLHLYDMERIEVLNGPQGTTFGASSMAGAIRYITNKPDVNSFGAGVDFDGGQIQGAQQNWTYEGFANIPLIDGRLALRASAFSASHGGFIDNLLTTRTWVNGAVSNNASWARNNYNREHEEGARIALRAVLSEGWNMLLSYDYQRQTAFGAWDEDLIHYGPRKVSRFGPESLGSEDRIGEFRVDGDIGIADLVFASTYWALPTRRWDEYSQYMENFAPSYTQQFPNGGAAPGAQEEFTCVSGPAYGGTPFTPPCGVPTQFYEYHTNPERWSDELRLLSKSGGRLHWLVGAYWEKTRDKNSGSTYYMPGLNPNSAAFLWENSVYGTTGSSLPPTVWYAGNVRSDYLQTSEFANISFDITSNLSIEVGESHFHSDFKYTTPFAQFAYAPVSPGVSVGSSNKWDSRAGINYKPTEHVMLYGVFSQGFRDGGSNSGFPAGCYAKGVPQQYVPDTLNNYEIGWKTTSLNNRLLWNGAAYLMNWQDLQTLIYDINICSAFSFNANVGQARIKGVESNFDYHIDEHWSLEGAASYTDSRVVSSQYAAFEAEVGERLPFVPYFSWSANVRYQHPLGARLTGYAQFDAAHKGDMWNDLHVAGSNGFPRMLQPAYTLMNLRLGVNPNGGNWLAEFYITNLADKNAIIYINTGNFDLRDTTNEPRVYGLRVNYRFGKVVGGAE